MAEVHHFAYGWVNPILAFVMSTLGCLLGIMLATKARTCTGRSRTRLLIYASVAIGATGIWQMHFVAMLGFEVPDSVLRYDPVLTLASLLVAVVVVGAGLFVAGSGTPRFWRLLTAGALVGVGVAVMHYTGMAAVRIGGSIEYEPRRFVISVAVAMVAATVALWFTVALKGLHAAVFAALVMGGAISGMHYVGMAAVRVRLGAEHSSISGADPLLLVPLVVLIGWAAVTMLAFFTIGTATASELHAIFSAPDRTGEIEPWMIEEVTTRTSVDVISAHTLACADWQPLVPLDAAMPTRRPPGPRPTPGITPVWRIMPVWGTATAAAAPAAAGASATAAAKPRRRGKPGRVKTARRKVPPAVAATPQATFGQLPAKASALPHRYPPAATANLDSPAAPEPRRSGWRDRRRP